MKLEGERNTHSPYEVREWDIPPPPLGDFAMNDCICHTEGVALGYTDCDFCEAAADNDEVVTYDDLIATHHQALLDEYLGTS